MDVQVLWGDEGFGCGSRRPPSRPTRRCSCPSPNGAQALLLRATREEEIDGTAASEHPAAALFVEEGFVRTAMGLQLRPGIALAESAGGGEAMAEQRDKSEELVDTPRGDETRETEHERVRSSNDRDQALERAGETAPHNRGYDEAVGGRKSEATDPDSAASEVDRDDIGGE